MGAEASKSGARDRGIRSRTISVSVNDSREPSNDSSISFNGVAYDRFLVRPCQMPRVPLNGLTKSLNGSSESSTTQEERSTHQSGETAGTDSEAV